MLCANDRVAVGVLAAAFQRRIKVGRDADCSLRVAGHDDQPTSRYTSPPLTTVAQDVERLAHTSLSILLARIEAGDGTRARLEQVRLGARLVVRASA